MKYTREDFKQAKFAEHEDGRIAMRVNPHLEEPWESLEDYHSDANMAHNGWVPVPGKPTITESQFKELSEDLKNRTTILACALERAGIAIIPDPEPTDEELLAGIIRNIDDWQSITSPELLAKYLNTAGVTPPKENN